MNAPTLRLAGRSRAANTRTTVRCPECGTVTGALGRAEGRGGYMRRPVDMDEVASGPEDGFRCLAHSRTEPERWRESVRALERVDVFGGGD